MPPAESASPRGDYIGPFGVDVDKLHAEFGGVGLAFLAQLRGHSALGIAADREQDAINGIGPRRAP